MLPKPILAVLSLALLVSACAKPSEIPVPVTRHADSGLVKECDDPTLTSGKSDNDFAVDGEVTMDAYIACKRLHHDLIMWERNGSNGPPPSGPDKPAPVAAPPPKQIKPGPFAVISGLFS